MKKIKKILLTCCVLTLIGCSSKYHTVKKNETLYSISMKEKVSVKNLMNYNGLSTTSIKEGQRLRLIEETARKTMISSNYHTVVKNETLYGISNRYNISVDDLKKYNNLESNIVEIGQRIYLESKRSIFPKETTKPNKNTKSPTVTSFNKPIKDIVITSPYGPRIHPTTKKKSTHHGIDLRAKMNTPVYAPYAGLVTYSGWMDGYGKVIILDHGKGYTSRYAHLNRWNVKKGKDVDKGELIGKTGNTGRSTGPHLHYEIRKNGKPIDPTETLFKKK